MTTTVHATFDGLVLKPEEPIQLAPNTRVLITIAPVEAATPIPQSFLRTAKSLNLQGPPDWSERLNDYLYGEKPDARE